MTMLHLRSFALFAFAASLPLSCTSNSGEAPSVDTGCDQGISDEENHRYLKEDIRLFDDGWVCPVGTDGIRGEMEFHFSEDGSFSGEYRRRDEDGNPTSTDVFRSEHSEWQMKDYRIKIHSDLENGNEIFFYTNTWKEVRRTGNTVRFHKMVQPYLRPESDGTGEALSLGGQLEGGTWDGEGTTYSFADGQVTMQYYDSEFEDWHEETSLYELSDDLLSIEEDTYSGGNVTSELEPAYYVAMEDQCLYLTTYKADLRCDAM
jgi:hypothetical protein